MALANKPLKLGQG